MALFKKAEPASEPLSKSPPEPDALPAPPASELERKIRSEIWAHISPGLASAAGLQLPELLEFVSGARRLSHAQITALARKMGFVTAPATGLDVLRDTTAAWLRRSRFTKTMIDELGVDLDDLTRFSEGLDLSSQQLGGLARLLFDAAFDPASNTLRPLKPPEIKAILTRPPPAKGRSVEDIVGAGAERIGLGWSAIGRAPRPLHGSLSVKAGPVWPQRPGWA